MKLSDILHENGNYWVLKDSYKGCETYTVMRNTITHSESVDEVTYPDITLAIARCDYLARRA
jgi:hypothetical protein